MRRFIAALAACLLIAACGGGHHRHAAGGSVHPPGWGKPIPGLLPKAGVQGGQVAFMFDTITPSALAGLSPRALAGYTAGAWPTFLGLIHAYPRAVVKSIAIGWGYQAHCLDVEPGDAIPSQVVAWINADRAAGFKRPCVYSSLWEFVNQIRPLLAQAGVARNSIWEWDADYNGRPAIDPSFDATQFTDHAYGRNLDESVVSLAFLELAPTPAPKPVSPYAFLPNTVRHFGSVVARERSTIIAWDKHACREPARRPVCVSSRRHMLLLAGRINRVARYAPNGHQYRKAQWRRDQLGRRYQTFLRRLA